jgi:hypothetical protein
MFGPGVNVIKLLFIIATTFSITSLSTMTFSIMTLSIKGLFVTLSINDIQQKRHSALLKCHYAD